jgi:hypothetical protein
MNYDLPPAEDLWGSGRPELDAIRWEAARRIASPWAVFAYALVQSLLTIPYPVRYRSQRHPEGTPPNLAVCIVGRSGAGKSTASNAAALAVRYIGAGDLPEATIPRSGEAIPASLAWMEPAAKGTDSEPVMKWKRADHALWAHWDEVGQLGAQGTRQGSTLLDSLKSLTSGERIGGQNSRGDGLTIPRDSYRAVLTVAAQPRMSAPLFSDVAISGGFTARFLFLPAEDPSAADRPIPVTETDTVTRGLAQWDGVRFVDALPEMDAAHEQDARAALRGDREAIDSRLLLMRAVVAIGLANMAGRAVLVPEDWHLAGCVIAASIATRDDTQAQLSEPAPDSVSYVLARVAELEARGTAWRDVEQGVTAKHRSTFRALRDSGQIARW